MSQPSSAPAFSQALRFWHKLGWVSFGGPAGQIALMHQELVERRRWISERRFMHALNYCMVLPGPEAQQLATYIGWLMHGIPGGILAGALFILPSLLILILLSWLYMAYAQAPLLAGVLYVVKAAVLALIAQAAWRLASRSLKSTALRALALFSLTASAALALPFPLIVLAAALFGWWGRRWIPAGAAHSQSKDAATQAALIDDHSPTPLHARHSWRRLSLIVVCALLLWAVPLLLLALNFGPSHPFPGMAWFFTKAALLTFGGAYAVLPYVYQGVVHEWGWLTPGRMMDGLALGESTPGPLIMIVAFVGFVAAWEWRMWPGHSPLAAGVFAACLVSWYTFLPSFLFILAGGPLVERSRNDLQLQAPLSAISAAVVGMIVLLGLQFGAHLLWPQGWQGLAQTDWLAAGLTLLAWWALQVRAQSALRVLAGAALLGMALSAAGWRTV
ncbi:chromate efflux transporter [Massilia sp. W12]|uniref:chromate efflux transporter n=1 Tax=Massilia sp. W12 TaxID=3126507 RepID=UPI0030D3093F